MEFFSNATPWNSSTIVTIISKSHDLCQFEGIWLWRIIVEVALAIPVEIAGLIGNMIAFVVLLKQKPRTTTSVLLQFLAVADTFVLLCSFLLNSSRTLHICFIQDGQYMDSYPMIFVYGYPFVYMARFCSTWFTVLLTVDRFIAVARPLHAQRLCTLSRIYKEGIVLLLCGVLYSIPRFFEHRLDPKNEKHGFGITALLNNKRYTIAYRIILFFLVMYVIPIGILSGLNMVLIRTLRKARESRGLLRHHVNEVRNKRDATIVVAIVVIVFIVCNIPAMIAHLLWSLELTFKSITNVQSTRRYLSIVNNFLVTLNSAINFVIYCVFSRNFRRTTERLCTGARKRYIYNVNSTGNRELTCSNGSAGNSVNIHMNPMYSRYG